ncbi:DUF1471 domain-containing protein [Dickeya dianthicola]|uniref:DUF1471 domain-containing protein n=1 Tax=Dickeya dianthicola TaxID=204039 RepID=A0AAP6VCL9_9GAMM|nr:DUF1471 domain-containing protein [Dickeya dianthicola]MBI0451545.1 DUF1471 domain-containing protein [Dickeya dianthicola]MBI0455618.1 DUF1471 domain-containing protein [Dickeya dianthicola]MBI0460280.1 DUF1471 domain-containing protein [Dickeya dianthicola]MBI0463117.1 DUF1471 domain-containing protein [Dickeya dianthicola]
MRASTRRGCARRSSAAGAKSFRIISATGNDNQLRGVAELYN